MATNAPSLAHHGVKLLLTNQFQAAKQLFHDKAAEEPNVALLHSFLSYGNAISSYSEADLKACIESCKRSEAIGEKLEKAGKKSDDLGKRIQGLLIQADTDLLTACIQLVEENYLKMMWNMRKSYNKYEDVEKLVVKYTGPMKSELTGWVKYGTGLFNLLLSQLPPSVLAVADTMGFEGDRDKGLKLLTECQQGHSFNAPFAALLMLVYYLTISPLTGDVVPGAMEHAKKLIDWGNEHYPNGAFFALMESRYWRALNEPRKAIEVADKASKLVGELPSVEMLFHYQQAWCAFFLMSWQECAEDFDMMLHSTLNGSYVAPGQPKPAAAATTAKEPAQASAQGSYAYQIGLCYAMLGDWHKASWYMESVPVWLKKAGGAPKEIDLYAKRKSEEFLSKTAKTKVTEEVFLDICDLLNAWNGYSQMPASALAEAQQKLLDMKTAAQKGVLKLDAENLVRLDLSLASVYSARADHKSAYDLLNPLVTSQKALLKSSRVEKIGLNAFFYYQLAFECFQLNDINAAEEWHKKSAKAKGFDLFKQLQVRLHTLKLKIKANKKK